MAVYSVGTPIVGAQVKFKKDGEDKILFIQKGDELTNIVFDRYPDDLTLEKATVAGFTLKSFQMPRGSGRIYDGVPTYLPDNNGDCRYGLVEEVSEIDNVLIEIPGATEDAPSRKTFVKLADIKSFEGGTEVETGSEEDETTVKDPVDPSEVETGATDPGQVI